MIVDIHTHTLPDGIAAAAFASLSRKSHTKTFSDGTAAALSRSAKAAGIDLSVVQPAATNPRQVPHINDSVIEANEQTPKTRLLSFGCIHPDFPGWHEELGRLAAAGVKGVKIQSIYQGVDIDDPRSLRVLTRAGELGLVVLMHAGIDVGCPDARQAMPEKILNALKRCGPVTLVLAHMGGWRCWRQARELLAGTGVYIDTAFSLGPMTPIGDGYYKTAESLSRLREDEFVLQARAFGTDRVLFGTDSPWEDQAAELARVRVLPFTEEEKAAVLGGNAARLLGL